MAITPEVQGELTTDKVKMKPKKQLHDWPNKMDTESKEGAIILESKKSKVGKGTLQKDSLVMKTDDDWVNVSECKKNRTTSVALPNASLKQKSTYNHIKPSEDDKIKEALSYVGEADVLLDPTSSETLSRPDTVAATYKQVDNAINEVTKDKLVFFGLGLLYWIAVSPMIISGVVFASAHESVIIWPLLTIVGMMASPLWLFICWGSSCAQNPNQEVLVILSWIINIELIVGISIASWPANSSKDT